MDEVAAPSEILVSREFSRFFFRFSLLDLEPLLDTDCRMRDGWGREVTADCRGTSSQIALFVTTV